MNLNNISLPPQLMADLYPHSLVEGAVAPTAATAVPLPPLPALGRGGKGILIVVNKEDAPFLPDGELDFLTKVLTACGLGLADVAIVNWGRTPHNDANTAIEQFKAKAVILFDVAPTAFKLPADLPPYTVHAAAGRQYVAAPALKLIEAAKETKAQLWVALKQLFGI